MSVQVFAFDPEGNLASEFPSVTACAEWLGVTQVGLDTALRRKKPCGGYLVRRENTPPAPWGFRVTDTIKEEHSHHARMTDVAEFLSRAAGKPVSVEYVRMANQKGLLLAKRWKVERVL